VQTPPEHVVALLTTLPAAYHAGVTDVLLTALALAVAGWRPDADGRLLVDLEGHGRAAPAGGVDLDGTVGWFTSVHPVRLEVGRPDVADVRSLGRAIKAIKSGLRATPGAGLGFGLLRYVNPDTAATLREWPGPEIGFNYLGRLPAAEPDAAPWSPAAEGRDVRGGSDAEAPVAYVLDINAYVADSAAGPSLVTRFSWPDGLLDEDDVAVLGAHWARALAALGEHAAQPGIGGRIPADLPLVPLSERDVSRLEAAHPHLVDVWPVTPLQEGMLYHARYDDDAPEVYTVQLSFGLPPQWERTAVRDAVADLLTRHPHMRAAFWYKECGEPVRVVPGDAEVPYREVDLSGVPAADREDATRRLLAEERLRRFDMTAAPLLRLLVIRTDPDRYRAALTCHHVLLDGWSLSLLAAELSAVTRSAARADYGEYLGWLVRQDRAAAETAWRRVLAGFDEPTLVGPSTRRPRVGAALEAAVDLPAELTATLTAVARRGGVTMNTVVQGAWGLVLSELVGRADVAFGSTVSGRPPEVPGIERMLGFFLNTVPVRIRIDPGDPMIDLLRRVQDQQAGTNPHHHLGLAAIQRAVGLDVLFDTLTVFENYPVDPVAAQSSDVEIHHSLHYPLGLFTFPGTRMRLELRYQPDVFTAEQAAGIVQRLTRLLDRIARDPHQLVGRLLGTSARKPDVPPAGGRPPVPATVARLFEDQVARTPSAVAVWHGEVAVRYADLNSRANRLAHHLLAHGAGPERFVALRMTRSVEMVVAVLAVAKSGAAYVPVDPGLPAAVTERMLADVEPVTVLTDVPPTGLAGRPETDPRPAFDPAHPAYMLFTSGSTGDPKGVVVTHQAVADLVRWADADLGVDRLARVLAATPLTFDVSVFELLAPLCRGGAVELVADLNGLAGLAARPPSLVAAVPSALAAVLRRGPIGVRVPTVVFAGEVLTADATDAARTALGAGEILNAYGPTEATVYATVGGGGGEPDPPPIGRPRGHTRVHLLDERMIEVPVNRTGQIHLAGVGLARGYRGAPALTADRFRPDPFGAPGSRMYRTGDLARWRPDGSLDYVGRVDDQVKIRGVRVQPAQVAARLAEHPRVVEAAVVPARDRDRGPRLVGYVVPTSPGAVTATELRRHLTERLVGQAVPAVLEFVAALPRTPHGKVDHRALPAPAVVGHRSAAGPREEALCRAFAELLDLPTVGVDDNFFDLGGHSLTATRLLGLLRTEINVDLDIRDLHAAPTVAELARRLP
jgi:amino acid adenylation domain-containing protein/non-ribosomal peptide synthase protein (TIGR01720 family)